MTVDELIARWLGKQGGAERANYQMFLTELTQALGLEAPNPKGAGLGDYEFEAPVRSAAALGTKGTGRIDLYKRGHFILEAKQSQIREGETIPDDPAEPPPTPIYDLFGVPIGIAPGAKAAPRYDRLMADARIQAERYALALPTEHRSPPFLIVADIGRAFELYFDYGGNGRGYAPFPDERSYRIPLGDLAGAREIAGLKRTAADTLRAVWTDPDSLDPRLRAAEVTRDIASRLSRVAAQLEKDQKDKHPGDAQVALGIEATSLFLMRMLFCMFAEDVELLPRDSFKRFLEEAKGKSDTFWRRGIEDLWSRMNDPNEANRYWSFGDAFVKYFNGNLFSNTQVFDLPSEFKNELFVAAGKDWRAVEPAIFGTLLEQVLTTSDRAKLGAHYTPRAYVERLVEAVILDVLRPEWEAMLDGARAKIEAGDSDGAVADARLPSPPVRRAGARPGVRHRQFSLCRDGAAAADRRRGARVRRRAGGGHRAGSPSQPVPRAGAQPARRSDRRTGALDRLAALSAGQFARGDHLARPPAAEQYQRRDARRLRRGAGADRNRRARHRQPAPARMAGGRLHRRQPALHWRKGAIIREAAWSANTSEARCGRANPHVPKSADFVMQWWDRAADILTREGTRLRRFGFVTTNSITQVFSRRVIEGWLAPSLPSPSGEGPGLENVAEAELNHSVDTPHPNPSPEGEGFKKLHLVLAIPDHPWTRVTKDAAAVRIAITVADAGAGTGKLLRITGERGIDSDAPELDEEPHYGAINADLSVGTDVTKVVPLKANEGLCSPGVKLHGAGFIVTPAEAKALGLGTRPGLENHIREYRNGRDLLQRPRGVMVIDLFGLSEADVSDQFPEVADHLLTTVLIDRQKQVVKSPTNDARSYARNWWVFGKPRTEQRPALQGLPRYIATTETSKHRIFQFVDGSVLADNMVVVMAIDKPSILGVLSSQIHAEWVLQRGGWLGFGNDNRYSKSLVFEPFPFPAATPEQSVAIAGISERLDGTRRAALAEDDKLTMTGLYNLVAAIRHGTLDPQDEAKAVRARARIVAKLHDDLDAAVAAAYGWGDEWARAPLPPAEIVARLVALNAERAAEEAAGTVRWLRPDYQIPRFA